MEGSITLEDVAEAKRLLQVELDRAIRQPLANIGAISRTFADIKALSEIAGPLERAKRKAAYRARRLADPAMSESRRQLAARFGLGSADDEM